MGNRDCGKGVFAEITKTALEKYTNTINATYFLADNSVCEGDKAKKNSWMIPLQFTLIVLTQEVKFDNENRGIKIDGVTIKMFCSGGDIIEARRNYENEISFTLEGRLLFMCNDIPKIKPNDTLESCISFETTKQFKSQEWITAEAKIMTNNGKQDIWDIEKKKYKVGDNDIKTKCQTVEWANAHILLMIENYKDIPVITNSSIGDDEDDLNRLLLKNFTFTKHEDDFVSNKEIKKWIEEFKLNASFKKIKTETLAEGCIEFKKNNERGFKYLRTIPKIVITPIAEKKH